jgi:hypothetical protein
MEMSQGKSLYNYVKQKCHFFLSITKSENRNGNGFYLRGLVPVWWGGRKVCGRVHMVQYCLHIYVNGKMIPVKGIPGMGEIKENGGRSKFKYDIFVNILHL